jgi:DNA-binding LacI/PurR family transcriptional regulator
MDLWVQESQASAEENYGSAYEFTNGKQLVRNLLKLSEPPTAVMTCNDLTAFGVINELNEQGIDVPREMSVIGFDNIEFSQMVTPGLTTVDVPKYELGRFSCKMLLDILIGTTIDVKEIVLQPKLIVRQSVTSPE